MHELGIAKELFEVIKKYAKENSLSKVTKIVIKVGIASGIDKDFLRHSFVDHILPGTIAENSSIEFDLEPVTLKCKNCNEIIQPEGNDFITCPKCKSHHMEIISGKQVYVESLEGY